MMFIFDDQSFVNVMYGVCMMGKQVYKLHWCIAEQQQRGKPYGQDIAEYIFLHLICKDSTSTPF